MGYMGLRCTLQAYEPCFNISPFLHLFPRLMLQIKLFNFPCVVGDAPGHMYGGHSSHVMNVRWSADETFAVSVGGRDRGVFQWRLVHPLSPEEQQRQLMAQQQVGLVPLDRNKLMWGPPRQPL
jgi:microtubule-associated protein-like 6